MEVNKQSIQEMHGTKLFEGLTIDELTELYKLASMEIREAGETVITEAQPGDRFYWVKSGRLEVQLHKVKDDPKPLVLNTIKPGEIFGEMTLLGKSRRTASIIVRNSCSLLAWKRKRAYAPPDFPPFAQALRKTTDRHP